METVKSADGTVIAYDRSGDRPALVVSVGAFCTRQSFVATGELKRRFTVATAAMWSRSHRRMSMRILPPGTVRKLALAHFRW
jgi:hypothetical protein